MMRYLPIFARPLNSLDKRRSWHTTATYALAEIAKGSTGVYYKDILPDAAGNWHYRWSTTGTPTLAEEGRFHVRPRLVASG